MRVNTGPYHFPDDWPGYFMRGDDALSEAHTLSACAATIENEYPVIAQHLRKLAAELERVRIG